MQTGKEIANGDYVLKYSAAQFVAVSFCMLMFAVFAWFTLAGWIFHDTETGQVYIIAFAILFCVFLGFLTSLIFMRRFRIEVRGEKILLITWLGKNKKCVFSDIERYRSSLVYTPKIMLILKNQPFEAVKIFASINPRCTNMGRFLKDMQAHNIQKTIW